MVKYLIFLINLVLACCYSSQLEFDSGLNNTSENESNSFSYKPIGPKSPANWQQFAPECGGRSQSPINIEKIQALKSKIRLAEIKGTKWTEVPRMISIENNGHTVRLLFSYEDGFLPNILVNEAIYEMNHLHFHFGLNRNSGSEHHINNRAYAMEGHAVFYNRDYATFDEALTHRDGLAVIGRLYDEVDILATINTDFGFLWHVLNPNDTYNINRTSDLFSLQDVMGNLNFSYYMYRGSLTTPDCNEVVTWCVGTKPLRISRDNLDKFRQLKGHDGLMAPNYRPLQKLNGRSVYKGGSIFE